MVTTEVTEREVKYKTCMPDFFLVESSLNSSIPFFSAFYDKQVISCQCFQKLGCDTVLSAGPVDSRDLFGF